MGRPKGSKNKVKRGRKPSALSAVPAVDTIADEIIRKVIKRQDALVKAGCADVVKLAKLYRAVQ